MHIQLNLKLILEFQDLLRKMLDFDKATRITPDEAINHSFFQSLNKLRRWSDMVVDAREPEEQAGF